MNQASTTNACLPIANSLLAKMGLATGAVPDATRLAIATRARGSLRDLANDVVQEGLANGGTI